MIRAWRARSCCALEPLHAGSRPFSRSAGPRAKDARAIRQAGADRSHVFRARGVRQDVALPMVRLSLARRALARRPEALPSLLLWKVS